MNNHQTPIVLCHVACSGGTLIFRKLCERFGFWGLSEVSHHSKFSKQLFYPFDPEVLMYANGWISEEEFASAFGERLVRCHAIAKENKKRLLIREHTHSLFFRPEGIRQHDGFSWVVQKSTELFGAPCPVICTLRDPVDSWLGIKHSFRNEIQYGFDDYCKRYIRFYEQVSQRFDDDILVFKYEDFLDQPDKIFGEISQRLGLPDSPAPTDSILYSGNSGRQSDQLSRRPRRAYSTSFIRAVENSSHYTELISMLGYEDCRNQISSADQIRAKFNFAKKFVMDRILAIGRYGNRALKRASVSD